MAWLGEKRKTEFSWTPAIQAMSEPRTFEQNKHFILFLLLGQFDSIRILEGEIDASRSTI